VLEDGPYRVWAIFFGRNLRKFRWGARGGKPGTRGCVPPIAGGIYHNDQVNEMGASESNV